MSFKPLTNPKIGYLLCLVLIALPIFAALGKLPVMWWDESRLAVNSYEMYKANEWLVATYKGAPDMWNTKPPFVLWLQILSFKLFGVNEFALRIPSAIAGALTCILIQWFFTRKGKVLVGLLSVVILVTSAGFIKYHHSPRTGDFDAVLTLITTAYCLFFIIYLEEEKRKYLWASMLLITLAVMAKAAAGVIFLPALAICALYRQKVLTTLKQPAVYVGAAIFGIVVIGYYLLHEKATPGYIDAAKLNDWGGRYQVYNGAEGTYQPRQRFYTDLMKGPYFNFWYVFSVIGGVLGAFSRDRTIKNISVYLSVLSLVFLLVIAKSVNKNDWYDMPMYPMMSMLAGIGVYFVFTLLVGSGPDSEFSAGNWAYLFLLGIIVLPYQRMAWTSFNGDPGELLAYNTNMARYLKAVYHDEVKTPTYITVVDDEDAGNIEWYAKVISDKKKIPVRIAHSDSIPVPATIVVSLDSTKEKIQKTYDHIVLENLHDNNNITILQINGRKQIDTVIHSRTGL
jgi:4-amino-4-deoxy-L-arabinose transferase-like glycosyltransferase